jgi:hypothetical protein
MPAVLPDLIPEPGAIHTYFGPPAPAFVPVPALHSGIGPSAVGRFLQVSNRLSRPPLLTQSQECEFPLRPPVRCTAVPTQTALREARQVTSQVRLLPDSPANLAYPQNIRIEGHGSPLADLQLRADSKVDLFVWPAVEPLSPAEGGTTLTGGMHVVRADRLRISGLSIEAATGTAELARCRERMPAVVPDLIPDPGAIHLYGGAYSGLPAPVIVPAAWLHSGVGPWTVSHFLPVSKRLSRPPLLTRSRECEFPLRTAIRFTAVPTQVALREAWQVTSQVRLLPDSPANLAYPQRIESHSSPLADLQLRVDSKVESFVRRAVEPLAPADGATTLMGGMHVVRADRLRISQLSIEAATGMVELARCRERMPAVVPDLIPEPGAIHLYGGAYSGPPAPAIVPAARLRSGIGPLAVGHFSQVSNRLSRPPLLTQSRECEFPLRPAIRFTTVPTQAALRESPQATSQVRLVPDSPANLAYAQNIRIQGTGSPLADLQLRVDSKVESFVWRPVEPLSPAMGGTTVMGGTRLVHAARPVIPPLLIEAATGTAEFARCREWTPVVVPDLIPGPGPIHLYDGPPAPAIVPMPALHGGIGPSAVGQFLQVSNRLSRPPLLAQSQECEFPLRTAIRFTAVPTQTVLREARQLTSQVRLLPDSPANLAYPQNIRIESHGSPLADLQLRVDSKVESFICGAVEPLSPAVGGTTSMGGILAFRATQPVISGLSIETAIGEAATGTVELARCRERMPVAVPDLIPGPAAIHLYSGLPAPAIIPVAALRSEIGPSAVDHFLQVNNRVSRPALLTQSQECEFPLRPAIRCAVAATQPALREARQAISQIRLIPDSPANLAYAQNMRIENHGSPLADLQLRVDSKVESFVRRAVEPLAPADGETTSGNASFSSWVSSLRLATGRELPDRPWQPVPMFAGSTTMLPPQASWSSVFDGLRDRIFNPRIRSTGRAQSGEVLLKMRKAGLPSSILPVPFDFRWQRTRKMWDRAVGRRGSGNSVHLPTISFYAPASLESLLEGSPDVFPRA